MLSETRPKFQAIIQCTLMIVYIILAISAISGVVYIAINSRDDRISNTVSFSDHLDYLRKAKINIENNKLEIENSGFNSKIQKLNSEIQILKDEVKQALIEKDKLETYNHDLVIEREKLNSKIHTLQIIRPTEPLLNSKSGPSIFPEEFIPELYAITPTYAPQC